MSEAIELATAYIQIVPSMKGAQGTILDELVPGAKGAGEGAADAFGGTWKSGLARVGKAAAPLLTGAALVGAGKGLYSLGETFKNVSDTIRVGTGASGEALDGLVDVAKRVGSTVPAEWDNIANTVADVNTRMGLSGETLQTVASQYLEAGRILGEEIDITKTSAAFNAFGIEGENVSGAMDRLFQVSQATGMGMNDLASRAAAAAPQAQMLGFSFETTAGMIGAFDKAGLNSSQLMSAMSKGLVTLAKDGEAPQEAFERVVAEIGGFLDAGNEAAALDLASKVFGTRGATQFMQAIENGTLGVEDMMGAIGATDDTILGLAAETSNFAEKWQLVKNNAMLALEPLASSVFDALGSALGAVLPHLQTFGAWLAENQWVIGVVAGIIGVALTAAFFAWAASIWATTAALLANPITWIVVGIVALIAGLVALIANWDKVVDWLHGVWSAAVAWLSKTWSSIVETVTGAARAVWDAVSGAWTSIVDTVTGLGKKIWDSITGTWNNVKTATSDAINAVVGFITSLPGRALSALANLGTNITSRATQAWSSFRNAVSSGIDTAIGLVRGLPGRAVAALASLASQLTGRATQAWSSFRNAVSNGITQAVNLVRDLPGRVLRALGNIGSTLAGAGRSLIDGFTRGIRKAFSSAVDAVKGGMNAIRRFFPFSPAKEGPFAGRGYVTYSGQAMTQDFAESIEKGASKVRAATAAMQTSVRSELTVSPLAGAGAATAPAAAATMVDGPLVAVDTMVVRSEDDIRKISQRLQALIEAKLRAVGK